MLSDRHPVQGICRLTSNVLLVEVRGEGVATLLITDRISSGENAEIVISICVEVGQRIRTRVLFKLVQT